MQLRDRICPFGQAQPRSRHAERVATQLDDLVAGETVVRVHVFQDSMAVRLVAGRHRRVRREHDVLLHGQESVRKGHVLRHLLADQFDARKHGVTVVEVVDVHVDTQRLQRADAADAEDHLLCDAFFFEPAIQLPRQVPGQVVRKVRIEEVQRRVAKGGALPHLHAHLFVADRYSDDDARILQKVVPVLVVAVVRAVVLVDELLCVVLAPQNTNPDHRLAGVVCRLQDVTRQDAQPPGVDVQFLVQPKLHAEIGYSGRSVSHQKPPLCRAPWRLPWHRDRNPGRKRAYTFLTPDTENSVIIAEHRRIAMPPTSGCFTKSPRVSTSRCHGLKSKGKAGRRRCLPRPA